MRRAPFWTGILEVHWNAPGRSGWSRFILSCS